MTDLHQLDRLPAASLPPILAVQRDAQRAALLRAVAKRRRQRHAARGIAGLVACLAVALWCWPRSAQPSPVLPPLQLANCQFTTVTTNPAQLAYIVLQPAQSTVAAEWLVPTRSFPDQQTDDQTLLDLLTAADRPSGLVRIGAHVEFPDLVLDTWRSPDD